MHLVLGLEMRHCFTQMQLRMQVNAVSKRIEYHGELLEMVQAVIDAPQGGQIMMEGKAFNGINSDLVRVQAMVPTQAQFVARFVLQFPWNASVLVGLAGVSVLKSNFH